VKELGLEDDTVLRGGKVEIREVPTGTYLMKEESHKVRTSSGLCLVLMVLNFPLKNNFARNIVKSNL
jgi:hypothetical protein